MMKKGEIWLCVSLSSEYFDQLAWKDDDGDFHWYYWSDEEWNEFTYQEHFFHDLVNKPSDFTIIKF